MEILQIRMEPLESKYLKRDILSINDEFIKKPDIGFPADINFYEPVHLPKSQDAIEKGWFFYRVVAYSTDDFRKEPIKKSEFQLKKHKASFKFHRLEGLLNMDDFKDDFTNHILKQQNEFYKILQDDLPEKNNNLQIKNSLKGIIDYIQESINLLDELKVNKYQKIVKDLYVKSYRLLLKEFAIEYPEYLPPKKNKELDSLFLYNKIDEFMELENELIKRGFLEKTGKVLYWNDKHGYIVKLVNFCRILEHEKFFSKNVDLKRIISFFEKRYNLEVGDQKKPTKHKNSIKVIKGDFFPIFK